MLRIVISLLARLMTLFFSAILESVGLSAAAADLRDNIVLLFYYFLSQSVVCCIILWLCLLFVGLFVFCRCCCSIFICHGLGVPISDV